MVGCTCSRLLSYCCTGGILAAKHTSPSTVMHVSRSPISRMLIRSVPALNAQSDAGLSRDALERSHTRHRSERMLCAGSATGCWEKSDRLVGVVFGPGIPTRMPFPIDESKSFFDGQCITVIGGEESPQTQVTIRRVCVLGVCVRLQPTCSNRLCQGQDNKKCAKLRWKGGTTEEHAEAGLLPQLQASMHLRGRGLHPSAPRLSAAAVALRLS